MDVTAKPMKTAWRSVKGWLTLLLLVALVACGGPAGGPPNGGDPGGGDPIGGDPIGDDPGGDEPDAVFAGRQPFGGPLPAGTAIVSLDAFKQLLERDDVEWDSLERQARADHEAAEQFEFDRAEMEQLAQASPGLARLLEKPDPDDPGFYETEAGEWVATVRGSDGETFEVVLLGPQDWYRDFLDARARFGTKENQADLYMAAYASLPQTVRETLPTPSEVEDGDAALATAAVATLSERVRDLLQPPLVSTPVRPPGYPASPADERGGLAEVSPWQACDSSPLGLLENFSWPLKYFQTSIKSQGNRGSCTAFALAAAAESITAMTQGVWVDISEQHLYFQARGIWQHENASIKDGFRYTNVPEEGGGYRFRAEQQWTYNRSMDRITTQTGFVDSCADYDETCSDTVHQGKHMCVEVGSDTFCLLVAGSGSNTSGFSFSSIPFPDISTVLWRQDDGDEIPLDLVRYYLQTGHPLLVSLHADHSFNNPWNGYVSPQAGSGGSHVVLIVGFITEEQILAHPVLSQDAEVVARAEASDGGFFVVKNSWGCHGDAGYLYVPVSWASQNFGGMRLPQRGPAPVFDAFAASLPPSLEIAAPADGSSYLVSPLLEVTFVAITDPAECCTVTWVSSQDGPLGSGKEITASFAGAEPGPRTITATATRSDGDGAQATRSITIDLTTNAPNVTIVYPPGGQLFQGVEYTFVAEEFSGPNTPLPCSDYVWTSSLPGEGPWFGCTPLVSFATTGPRTVTVSLTNQYGQIGTDEVDLMVEQPPADGPPVVSITAPTAKQVFTVGQRAYVAFSVDDPSPPATSIEWKISYGSMGDQLPITLITDPSPPASAPSNRYFVPSQYVTPICFHDTNPNLDPYLVWLWYTNAQDKTTFARQIIYLNADVGMCIN